MDPTRTNEIEAIGAVQPNSLLLQGIDSLYVSFYLDTTTCTLDWEELGYLKEKARRDHGNDFADIQLGTERFALLPYGKKPYTFILGNKAFEVRLAERMKPSCHVRFSSEALWTDGLDKLMNRLRSWFASVTLREIRPEAVARADWAFDFCVPVVDFTPDHFVSRAAKDATWRENKAMQTVQLGQGEVVVRIYDKVAEITQQSDKSWFFELWGTKANVWRVEFQVRRERLKMAGIRTLDDLCDLQADLLRELATSHTTLRRPSDDSNRSRWPFHPLWQELLQAIDNMPQTGLVRAIDPLNSVEYRLDRAGKSILGNLKNLAVLLHALRGGRIEPDLDAVMEDLSGILARHHDPIVWEHDVRKRIDAFELGQ